MRDSVVGLVPGCLLRYSYSIDPEQDYLALVTRIETLRNDHLPVQHRVWLLPVGEDWHIGMSGSTIEDVCWHAEVVQ